MKEKEFLTMLLEKTKSYSLSGHQNFPILPADVKQFIEWCKKNDNEILNKKIENCGEYLTPIIPTLKLKDITVGQRLQFHNDKNRVREILEMDREYILVKTLGCTEDLPYYKCHYSYLKINETQIKELK